MQDTSRAGETIAACSSCRLNGEAKVKRWATASRLDTMVMEKAERCEETDGLCAGGHEQEEGSVRVLVGIGKLRAENKGCIYGGELVDAAAGEVAMEGWGRCPRGGNDAVACPNWRCVVKPEVAR